jgi:hypothetical protein
VQTLRPAGSVMGGLHERRGIKQVTEISANALLRHRERVGTLLADSLRRWLGPSRTGALHQGSGPRSVTRQFLSPRGPHSCPRVAIHSGLRGTHQADGQGFAVSSGRSGPWTDMRREPRPALRGGRACTDGFSRRIVPCRRPLRVLRIDSEHPVWITTPQRWLVMRGELHRSGT